MLDPNQRKLVQKYIHEILIKKIQLILITLSKPFANCDFAVGNSTYFSPMEIDLS